MSLQDKLDSFGRQSQIGMQPRGEAEQENMTGLQAQRQSRTDGYQREFNNGSLNGNPTQARKGRTGLTY
jgi:hypothetical protein